MTVTLAELIVAFERRDDAAARMREMGGSFASAIGFAFMRADEQNKTRLLLAFPELFAKYSVMPSVGDLIDERDHAIQLLKVARGERTYTEAELDAGEGPKD